MRVRLIFNVKNPGGILPFNHQNILSNIFRNLLKSNPDHSSFIYNFSSIKGKLNAVRNGIQLISLKATIVFSTGSEDFLNLFLELLMKEKIINVGSVFLEFYKAEREDSIVFNQNEYKYVCLSPIVLINSIDFNNADPLRFIDPSTDEFSDLLYESTLNRMEELKVISEEDAFKLNKFQIMPDKSFIDKAYNNNKKFSKILETRVDNIKTEVCGYTFPFTLYASEIIHNFIFNYGLGELCGNGLGMLDIAESNYSSRTLPISVRNERVNIETVAESH